MVVLWVFHNTLLILQQRKIILERRNQMKDERVTRKEMRREQQREKAKRLEEKMTFEKEMAEKYKPKKPEKKRYNVEIDLQSHNHFIKNVFVSKRRTSSNKITVVCEKNSSRILLILQRISWFPERHLVEDNVV